jgi:hypothetical protein
MKPLSLRKPAIAAAWALAVGLPAFSLAHAVSLASRPGVVRTKLAFEIPRPLKAEHDELHAELVKATQAGGRTGEAAEAVARALHPHFLKEEEFALPPLGLLPRLARERVTPGLRAVLPMTDRLKAELPQMLREHQAIVAALRKLADAAAAEGKPEHAQFAEKLMAHAQTEEQVTYPTAILIGEYVRLKLNR